MNNEPVSYMTALQLADFIDANVAPFMNDHQMYLDYATVMLRQQQAEIEALKMDIHSLTYGERLAKYFNKPVAWMEIEESGITEYKVWREPVSSKSIPLYTHPAKTLTDDDIKYDVKIKWDGKTTHHSNVSGNTPLHYSEPKTLTDRIAELENQLGFIASINRAGLGVVSGTPMPSEKIEKIWNSIEEQKDDNFHYGWKKCEQYYGFSHLAKTLTDEEVIRIVKRFVGTEPLVHEIEQAILRKAQEK